MSKPLPERFMVILALLQGLLLAWLYRRLEDGLWPANAPIWLVAIVAFVCTFGVMVLLSVERHKVLRTMAYILPFALLMSALGGYVGWQQMPQDMLANHYLVVAFWFTGSIAAFKALMYLQQVIARQPIRYPALFKRSWHNLIVFIESSIFTLLLWLILRLAAALFAVVGIDIFQQWLRQDWLVIPLLHVGFAFALIIFRNITHTADTIANVLQTLLRFLLPLISLVCVAFLFTLAFTGLDKLWQTGAGSSLVLWLQALLLFFVNAVYQDHVEQRPYGIILHRLIYMSVASLPIYSAIVSYGLWLRIDQYGLSVNRCWGILVCLLLATLAIAYMVAIMRRGDHWLTSLAKVNRKMGILVFVSMLLVNSPVLNLQRLSANNQIARLHSGKTAVADFDYQYFAQHLGRAGYLHIQKLQQTMAEQEADFVAKLQRLYPRPRLSRQQPVVAKQVFLQRLIYWPQHSEFPADLVDAIYQSYQSQTLANVDIYLLGIDLDNDQGNEFIVIEEHNRYSSAYIWQFSEHRWQRYLMTMDNADNQQFIKQLLDSNDIEVIPAKYQDLRIGSRILRVRH